MESLLSILLIVALVALSSSNRKKKAQRKQAQQKRAFAEAAQMNGQDKKSRAMEEWQNFLKETTGGAAVSTTMQSVVRKPTDTEQPVETIKAPARLPARVFHEARPKPAPAPEVPQEGMSSTQGESAEEHAAHLAKIHTEEERLHQTQQTLQEIRNLNRKKLRSAVVMSEVLGKPVSLRSRNHR